MRKLLLLMLFPATAHAGLRAHAAGTPLGPLAAYPKLLLCAAEQATYDWMLATDPDIAVAASSSDDLAVRRQEYLFSRIVTVYGGSQQMQLETIAKQDLRLP